MLGQIFLREQKDLAFILLAFFLEGNTPLNHDALSAFALALRLGTTLTLARPERNLALCQAGIYSEADGGCANYQNSLLN